MPMLYNAEGQPMGEIGDNEPVPLGRWVNKGGQMVQGNGAMTGGQIMGTTTGGQLTGGTNLTPGTGTTTAPAAGPAALGQPGATTGFPALVTGGTTGTGAGPATAGATKPTYSQLLAQYKTENPGLPAPTGDVFNAWAATKAPGGWSNDSGSDVYAGGAGTAGNNFNQSQGSQQSGAYTTNNNTTGTQNQTTGGTSVQNTTGTNTSAGTNTQNTTGTNTSTGTTAQNTTASGTNTQTGGSTNNTVGTTTNTGTSTTGVTDTLGFGDLLKGQVGTTQANDVTRNNFLTDVVQTGGSQFGSQVDQAVRNAISGPQMTGAGDSARARAAGYAGAQVGRNNMDQRLGAAQALAGPTGLQSLVASGNPYLGQTTAGSSTQGVNTTQTGTNFLNAANTALSNVTGTNTQSGSNTQNTTGSNTNTGSTTGSSTGATTGFQDLVSKGAESTAGTATGTGNTTASGLIPQAQQVSTGGGCVICTVGLEQKSFTTPRLLRFVVKHKLQKDWAKFRHAARGYFFLFTPLARWLLGHPVLAWYCMPIAKAVVYEEARIAGRQLPFKLLPWLYHWTWHFGCSLVGRFPVPNGVTDKKVQDVAKRHGVLFQINDGGQNK